MKHGVIFQKRSWDIPTQARGNVEMSARSPVA